MNPHLDNKSLGSNNDEQPPHIDIGANNALTIKEYLSEENLPLPEDDETGLDSAYSYLVLFASFMNFIVIFGCFNAFGIFQEYYLNTQFADKPASSIAWISTIALSVSLSGGIFGSPIISRIGIRRTFILGSIVATLGLALASFSTKSIALLTITQGLVFGFGGSIIINGSILMPSLWFKKHRSLAIGIVSSGSGFGGMVMGPIIETSLRKVGIEWSFRILCFITLAFTLTASIVLKPRASGFKTSSKKIFNFSLLKKPYTLFLCIGGFFAELGYTVLSLYFASTVVSIGQSRSTASNTILAFSAASGISRLASGYYAKWFGPNTTLIFAMTASSILMFAMWLPSKSFAVYYVFFVLCGFLCALFFPLGPVMIANNYDLGEVSQVNGVVYLFYGASTLVGNPLLGLMFDKIGNRTSYNSVIIAGGVSFMISGIVLFFQRIYSRKYMPNLKTGKI
ncbi:putative transporter MCH4 [Smittium culicis]|uniref:Putative transporter MCH4 n=1 Tax=Smittium culicis TaxID=133412 RepID=A0A1R1YR37_9FUNG|nr:putative transporter MCH4 [Smittium culicis]